ncbi:hypothetical protein VNO78_15643 [Psophocarpus tetragonolobus]|uniref:Uncharacterized protein n=1 Tax=Psophocarpus tetragonolobus TaxID=3891 RepID=A0AAN9SEY2_PSOTE
MANSRGSWHLKNRNPSRYRTPAHTLLPSVTQGHTDLHCLAFASFSSATFNLILLFKTTHTSLGLGLGFQHYDVKP